MSRRVSLPTADDLFRPTSATEELEAPGTQKTEPQKTGAASAASTRRAAARAGGGTSVESPRQPSGRVRHDEKMTVYVTADELLDIEHARLSLRRHQGIAVDRGRLVREAIAMVLADLEVNGDDSDLVKRLLQ